MGIFLTKKTAYAIAILTLGVLGSVWISGGMNPSDKNSLLSIESAKKNADSSPFFASLTLPTDSSGGKVAGTATADNFQSVNITENVVKAYGAKMLEQNPKGSGSTSVQIPSEGTLNTILAEQLESAFLTVPSYGASDIRVSSKTPTKEELVTYFRSLVASYGREFKSVEGNYFVAIVDAFSSGKTTDIQTHLNAASRFITALLSTQVPNGWSAFHIELLNLWQARLSLGSVIANGGDDPFKAYLAVTKLSDTVAQEDLLLSRLQREMANTGLINTP